MKHKNVPRSDEYKKKLIKRLNIISGQINGVSKMISDDRYCYDVLVQLSSIVNSIKSLESEVLKVHLETCVTDDIKEGNTDVIDEVMDLIDKIK